MGYLEKDESESECRAIQGTRQIREGSRRMFVIICYEVGFPGPGCGHTACITSVRPFSSILQRNPELCHGGTMTTTLKQENESHWLVVTMTRRLHTRGAFLRPS